MRLLHTADWHLGRVFQQVALLDDQALLLDQILAMVQTHRPDAVIIAGDVFDRANPRPEVIDLFDRFLTRLFRETPAAIVVIAGNHDAPERIGFTSSLHDPGRILIRGPLAGHPKPLLLDDDQGPVAISALPYAEIFAARRHYDDDSLRTPEHVLRRQLAEARALVPANARWVVAAHAFVQGARQAQSERSLDLVGGLETVPAAAFAGADYVALGHLHRAQAVGALSVRYAGSLMAYGFDETDQNKSVALVDLGPGGTVDIREIPLRPNRRLRIIEGVFDDIINNPPDAADAEDFVQVRLLDRGPIHDAIGRLRALYPNAVLDPLARAAQAEGGAARMARSRTHAPLDVFAAFYADVTGEVLEETERALAADVVATATAAGDEA